MFAPSSTMIPEPYKVGHGIHVFFRTELAVISYSLYLYQLWVTVLINYIYWK